MKIGVDAHVLHGIDQGSKTYLVNLYRAILEVDVNNDYTFVFGRDVKNKFFSGRIASENFGCNNSLMRIAFDTGRVCKKLQLDAFHTQYISPFYRGGAKSIVTVHDILFETHPQYFSRIFVARSKALVREAVRRSEVVLTVSEYSKLKICQIYGTDPRKVFVTPNGVDVAHFRVDKEISRQFVFEKHGISDFLLTVGRLEPRKNHIGLIGAYELAAEKKNVPPLIIIGKPDFGYEKIFERIKLSPVKNKIHVFTDVSYIDLPKYYSAASLFVYPSFAEGFGIPPLEALASGCRVICSSGTAMEEVFGGLAKMIDPNNLLELRDAIVSLTDSKFEYDKFTVDSLLEKYSWHNSANVYIDALRRIF